ncbi:MAG TPA: hypothetical protein VGL72_04060 [Bryobacteraceae bacterium]|jgi:hypothetical protein
MKLLLALVLLASNTIFGETVSGPGVRIRLGVTDDKPTQWDGSVTARGVDIQSISGWRFERPDVVTGTSWKASSRQPRLFINGLQFDLKGGERPVVPNGVIIRLSQAGAGGELAITTTQGNFTVRMADLALGKVGNELSGRVQVDLLPPVTRLTEDPDEEDYPASTVAKDGTLWLAYANFRHHPEHDRINANRKTAPENFDEYKAPTGGDQIVVRSFRDGKWGSPIEVSALDGDIHRPSIAVNGNGRVWVFWPQNGNHNFDIWARPIDGGTPGKQVQISSEAGTDMDPVAATDSRGRVWVAWQAWRSGHAQIVYATEGNGSFSTPRPVSPSAGNQWDPAITADASGRVTVAWDAYDNGNYDVYARTSAGGNWGPAFAVAATSRYEAYPSLTYDPAGRLWVAYEEGADGWGKDFGALSSTGVSVYQGRAIRVRGFEGADHAISTRVDPGTVLPGAMAIHEDNRHQNDSDDWLRADPARAKDRPAARSTENLWAPKNTLPRLTADRSGRLWLTFRSVNPVWFSPIGTVWTELVTSYNGSEWTPPVYLDHSDNLLDKRPAVASIRPGELVVVGSSDGRRDLEIVQRDLPANAGPLAMPAKDPYNNDLWVNYLNLGPAGTIQTSTGTPVGKPVVTPNVKAERDAIARMRAYRLRNGAQTLRLARGEFHRHSEVSVDGGFDGTRLDQWRYIIDAVDLDWVGCCDHDNGNGREYTWWMNQKETDLFYSPGRFSPIFSYERSVAYPEGHRNVLFAQRGIRTLPRLPKMADNTTGRAPDTQMLYRYLAEFKGVVASHTSATGMGTDWRDNDPLLETSVEIYQGDRQSYEKPGSPRSSQEKDSIGGYRPKGYVDLALEMGYKLAFEASSDHVSTHMSFANVLTTGISREEILDAFRKRHLYASTDNIVAEFRSGNYIMGDAFSTATPPSFQVKLTGTAPFSRVVIVKDNQYVYSQEPKSAAVSFAWRDAKPNPGKVSYYYVRGEQENGEIVWISPMWVTYTGK